jgi:hypothetical protein
MTTLLFEYSANNPAQRLPVMPQTVSRTGYVPGARAPAADIDEPKPPVCAYLAFLSWLLLFAIVGAYGNVPANIFCFVVALLMLGISCALSQHQENERRRQDPTVSRTGYVPPHARQRQRIPTSEEEADQESRRIRRLHEEEDETDEEIAQKVKGHLAQMLEAGELASAEGISLSEALQRVSSGEQEVKEDNKSGGTSDALANIDTVV